MQAAQASVTWDGQIAGFPFPTAFGNPIVANRGFQGELFYRSKGKFKVAVEKERSIGEF
jgi:hypothetical protein